MDSRDLIDDEFYVDDDEEEGICERCGFEILQCCCVDEDPESELFMWTEEELHEE